MGGVLGKFGALAVRRDHWKDVNLEIYYQPGHELISTG